MGYFEILAESWLGSQLPGQITNSTLPVYGPDSSSPFREKMIIKRRGHGELGNCRGTFPMCLCNARAVTDPSSRFAQAPFRDPSLARPPPQSSGKYS